MNSYNDAYYFWLELNSFKRFSVKPTSYISLLGVFNISVAVVFVLMSLSPAKTESGFFIVKPDSALIPVVIESALTPVVIESALMPVKIDSARMPVKIESFLKPISGDFFSDFIAEIVDSGVVPVTIKSEALFFIWIGGLPMIVWSC